MKFTKNQKSIILQIRDNDMSISFGKYLDEYFIEEIEKESGPYNPVLINLFLTKTDTRNKLKDVLIVWNYLLKHDYLSINIKPPDNLSKEYPPTIYATRGGSKDLTLTNLASPLWYYLFTPSSDFSEFVDNGCRTNDEVEFDEERERGAKSLFWTRLAVVIATVGMFASAILNYASLRITKDKSYAFPGTIKVMYYNPPKDTLIFKTTNK